MRKCRIAETARQHPFGTLSLRLKGAVVSAPSRNDPTLSGRDKIVRENKIGNLWTGGSGADVEYGVGRECRVVVQANIVQLRCLTYYQGKIAEAFVRFAIDIFKYVVVNAVASSISRRTARIRKNIREHKAACHMLNAVISDRDIGDAA